MRTAFEMRNKLTIDRLENALAAAADAGETEITVEYADDLLTIYLENLGYHVTAVKGKKNKKVISFKL